MKKKLLSLFFSFFLVVFIFSFFGLEQISALTCDKNTICPNGQICDSNPDSDFYGICVDPVKAKNNFEDTKTVEINLADHLLLRDGQQVSDVFSKPSDLINLVIRVVFVAAGLIIFMMVIMAGISMIAGKGDKNLEQAKTTMTNAGIGFLIIFAAYWIMQLIALTTGAAIGF